MGMYDSFFISYPLPIEKWVPKEYKEAALYTFAADGFQTKDLECCLESYYISNDGHIFKDTFDFESSKILERNPIYFHGHIKIYSPVYLEENRNGKFLWFSYDLKFTDSLLVCATMLSPTQKDIDELHRSL